MTGHDELLAQADQYVDTAPPYPGRPPVSRTLIADLAAALRAETERAEANLRGMQAALDQRDRLIDSGAKAEARVAELEAAAREAVEWWDDDTRGGTAEMEALRALLDVTETEPEDQP